MASCRSYLEIIFNKSQYLWLRRDRTKNRGNLYFVLVPSCVESSAYHFLPQKDNVVVIWLYHYPLRPFELYMPFNEKAIFKIYVVSRTVEPPDVTFGCDLFFPSKSRWMSLELLRSFAVASLHPPRLAWQLRAGPGAECL